MFAKDDEAFFEAATDSARRRTGIISLTKARNRFGWIAAAMTVFNAVFVFCGEPMNGLSTLTNGVFWIVVLKFDSDVKLLKTIDILYAANKLPTSDTKDAPKETSNANLPAGARVA